MIKKEKRNEKIVNWKEIKEKIGKCFG